MYFFKQYLFFIKRCFKILFSFFFFWKYLVETKGKSLEEIEKEVLKRK